MDELMEKLSGVFHFFISIPFTLLYVFLFFFSYIMYKITGSNYWLYKGD